MLQRYHQVVDDFIKISVRCGDSGLNRTFTGYTAMVGIVLLTLVWSF